MMSTIPRPESPPLPAPTVHHCLSNNNMQQPKCPHLLMSIKYKYREKWHCVGAAAYFDSPAAPRTSPRGDSSQAMPAGGFWDSCLLNGWGPCSPRENFDCSSTACWVCCMRPLITDPRALLLLLLPSSAWPPVSLLLVVSDWPESGGREALRHWGCSKALKTQLNCCKNSAFDL